MLSFRLAVPSHDWLESIISVAARDGVNIIVGKYEYNDDKYGEYEYNDDKYGEYDGNSDDEDEDGHDDNDTGDNDCNK